MSCVSVTYKRLLASCTYTSVVLLIQCSSLFFASRIFCTLILSTGLPALISRFRLFQQTLDANDVISYFYVALGLHSEKLTSITLDFIMHTAMVAQQNSNAPNARQSLSCLVGTAVPAMAVFHVCNTTSWAAFSISWMCVTPLYSRADLSRSYV